MNVDAQPATIESRCLNCRHALPDPRPRYCGRCGQEAPLRPPRFFEFVQQFGGAYLSTEGTLWRAAVVASTYLVVIGIAVGVVMIWAFLD